MHLNTGSAHVHFRDRHGLIHHYLFTNPKIIFSAHHLEDVSRCLNDAQIASKQGDYVVGYVSYEAASAFDKRFLTQPHPKWPLAWFAVYEDKEILPNDFHHIPKNDYSSGPWSSDTTKREYDETIQRIRQYIKKGETYQTNYTIRLTSNFRGNDFAFYQNLSKLQNASYSSYINLGDLRIICVSPELFFEYQNNHIITRPMKGTSPRGRWYEEDLMLRQQLHHSLKERAENVMIVDLLRNDLSRIARTGTVKVKKLFEIENYPTVYQMTSEIHAFTDAGLVDIFSALFPCGSITGAPKVSTMKIINEIENSPREVYCGSIGLMLPQNHYIFNVAIRTVLLDVAQELATYGVGGGITWDSFSESEYQEVFNKAAILQQYPIKFKIIETLRLHNGDYDLLSFHLERMSHSATYFGFTFHLDELTKKLKTLATHHTKPVKIRVLLSQNGDLTLETKTIEHVTRVLSISFSTQPIDLKNRYLYHKTTHRDVYTLHKNESTDETLLWNERKEITEFTTGNVVIKINDTYYTPPIASGLLQGTFRRHLLERGQIVEKTIQKSELKDAQEIWFINSVQGWVKTEFVSSNAEKLKC